MYLAFAPDKGGLFNIFPSFLVAWGEVAYIYYGYLSGELLIVPNVLKRNSDCCKLIGLL